MHSYLQHSINIKSTREKIWNVLIDVEKWNQWDKTVKEANLHEPFASGAKGTLISIDNSISVFFITEIKEFNHYCNYYKLPCFTKLHFIHRIEQKENICEVTFSAKFTGPLKWYFLLKQRKSIQSIMEDAMKNLSSFLV